jgi:cytochrome c-type biogenesis protein CcmH/NrfG
MTGWIIIIALTLVAIALAWYELCSNHVQQMKSDAERQAEYEAELDKQIAELERKIRERNNEIR